MSFSLDLRSLPISLRACRALVWTQAVYTFFTGAFVLLTAVLLGGSLPFHGGTVSGSGAATLGVVYVVAGLALGWLGLALGRLAPWARTGIVVMQVFLASVELFRAFDMSLSTLINVALYAGILALLFVPDTQRALRGSAQV